MMKINKINISAMRYSKILITIYFNNISSAFYFGMAEDKNNKKIKSSFYIICPVSIKPLKSGLFLNGNEFVGGNIENIYYQNKLKYLDKYYDRNK